MDLHIPTTRSERLKQSRVFIIKSRSNVRVMVAGLVVAQADDRALCEAQLVQDFDLIDRKL